MVSSYLVVLAGCLLLTAHCHAFLLQSKLDMRALNKRDNMFGNFDPNKFNAQVGASYNPNAVNGGSGGGGSSSTGGMSMFNPNAMMGGGSSTGGMTSMFNPNAMMGGGGAPGTQQGSSQSAGSSQSGSSSGSGSSPFDPNAAGGTSSGSASSGSSGSSGGGSMPHYDPNNVINTGAKYDPNAANSGMGAASGGSSPSFTNGMGMKAQQQLSPGAANWTGSGSGSGSGSGPSGFGSSSPGSSSSGSTGSGQSSGSGAGSSSGTFDPNSFGSSSSSGSTGSSSSSASASFGSSSGGGTPSQTGGQPQSQSGSVSSSSGGASQTGGGSGGSTGTFDPIKSNSMATSGFNPLNPMMGKDMTQIMGPQSQTGAKGPGNFDPGAVNTQMGANGMSLNMFGGAGGKTDLNKADASTLMGGAQGMMAGSNTINQGGNAFMSGGGQTGGSTAGSSQTGGSGSGSGSSGFNFDPNQMMGGGSGSSSGSSSSGTGGMSMFNPSAMMGGGSSGGSTGGSGSSSGSGGMSMFDPNAMLGGGSGNPMMPGGNMNPMMPGGSMTGSGSTSGTRNTGSSILDPMGAMSGNAQQFSGGTSLIDPMGFMNGGGLSGSMSNKFGVSSASGRSVPIVGTDRLRRETPQLNWRHGNFINAATGQAYNPMDPMGFIFAGNNKQYTKGNGVDIPTYDPDQFSYTYAGVNFQPFPLIPSSSGVFTQNYQTFGTDTITNPETTIIEAKSNASSTNVNSENSTSLVDPTNSEVITDEIIEHFQKMLNSTNMYPHAAYSGVPGMLGTGYQRMENIPSISPPAYVAQYVNPSFENLTQLALPHASYSGLPGMEGEGSQVQGSISSLSIAQLPQEAVLKQSAYGRNMNFSGSYNVDAKYNGSPGMLVTGSMAGLSNSGTTRIHTAGINLEQNRTGEQSHVNSQSFDHGTTFQDTSNFNRNGESGQSSYGTGTVKQTKISSWNGDWPGDASAGDSSNRKSQTWSGAWSDSWPKTNNGYADKSSKLSSGFGNSDQSASESASWDGSWPGKAQSNRKSSSHNDHSDEKDNFKTSLGALKDLISHLNRFPNNEQESRKDQSSNSGSFSDLVANWNKDMKDN